MTFTKRFCGKCGLIFPSRESLVSVGPMNGAVNSLIFQHCAQLAERALGHSTSLSVRKETQRIRIESKLPRDAVRRPVPKLLVEPKVTEREIAKCASRFYTKLGIDRQQ